MNYMMKKYAAALLVAGSLINTVPVKAVVALDVVAAFAAARGAWALTREEVEVKDEEGNVIETKATDKKNVAICFGIAATSYAVSCYMTPSWNDYVDGFAKFAGKFGKAAVNAPAAFENGKAQAADALVDEAEKKAKDATAVLVKTEEKAAAEVKKATEARDAAVEQAAKDKVEEKAAAKIAEEANAKVAKVEKETEAKVAEAKKVAERAKRALNIARQAAGAPAHYAGKAGHCADKAGEFVRDHAPFSG